jgi:Tol biopolymer transport system component
MWNVVPIKGTDRFIFTNNVDANQDIYSIKKDGTDRTRLTTNLHKDSMAYPSPDGSKIVFQSARDGSATDVFDIFIMDADGTNITNLTNTTDVTERYPTISPDGTKIAYAYRNTSGADEIWVMDIDGSNNAQLTAETGWTHSRGTNVLMSWNPDGSDIVFAMDSNQDLHDSSGGGIYRVSSSTAGAPHTPVELVSSTSGKFKDPVYNLDGSMILYCSHKKVFVLDAETVGATPTVVRDYETTMDDRSLWATMWISVGSDGNFE